MLEAWRSQAAADRAVRTAAWLVFGAAIGLLLGIDRRQEAVDAASVAIPLSPLDLSWVLDHVDDCFRWMQESDVEVQVALMTAGETPDIDMMMGEWGAPVTLNSWMWLCDAVLQREPLSEPPPLDDDTITWGSSWRWRCSLTLTSCGPGWKTGAAPADPSVARERRPGGHDAQLLARYEAPALHFETSTFEV